MTETRRDLETCAETSVGLFGNENLTRAEINQWITRIDLAYMSASYTVAS